MLHCLVCRSPLGRADRFCANCGAPAAAAGATVTGVGVAVAAGQAALGAGRLISSHAVVVGGFTPGMVIADRYRIIGLLGRGGMGEVYRADDLKLGQGVALKFLPDDLEGDPVRRERFYAEVRIARQIAHPNVCRVYDIAEYDGRHFLSMEFVDGEDLASLLTRIGHLPGAKAVDIARQLCAGVAAAHDKGVLHRDLKPANIMLDGRGRVRITDFGLAVAVDQAGDDFINSGTPAYMAPEQLAGEPASVRSDVYALGLVLYEIYTGSRAFTATTLAELRAAKAHGVPTAPSEVSRDVDPMVERVIQRCMEKDPRSRPASVLQVAAALPGGDPLAAALAAGETPSPEMVAASASSEEGLRPAAAWSLLAVFIVAVAAQIVLGQRAILQRRLPVSMAPAVMAERARAILRTAGHTDAVGDTAFGLGVDAQYLRYLARTDAGPDRWDRLGPQSRVFWYRQSPRPIVRTNTFALGVRLDDPPPRLTGDATVLLDAHGRLVEIRAIPPLAAEPAVRGAAVDWPALFDAAGLDYASWTPSGHEWAPMLFGDRQAWIGTLEAASPVAARVEAATYAGRVVHFQVVGPWTVATRAVPARQSAGELASSVIMFLLLALLLAGSAIFARRNLRLGRGDRRGAFRLAAFLSGALTVLWVVAEHHVAGMSEIFLFVSYAGFVLFVALLMWMTYLAVEPYVRRNVPGILVSWSRLVAGGLRDPLVGRDLLIGSAAGALTAALQAMRVLLPGWLGRPAEDLTDVPELAGAAGVISALIGAAGWAIFLGLGVLFFYFVARLLLKRDGPAIAAVVLVLMVIPALRGTNILLVMLLSVVINAIPVVTLARTGLLAMLTMAFTSAAITAAPAIVPTGAWHTPLGAGVLVIVAALAVYAFACALGGRPAFGSLAMEA